MPRFSLGYEVKGLADVALRMEMTHGELGGIELVQQQNCDN